MFSGPETFSDKVSFPFNPYSFIERLYCDPLFVNPHDGCDQIKQFVMHASLCAIAGFAAAVPVWDFSFSRFSGTRSE